MAERIRLIKIAVSCFLILAIGSTGKGTEAQPTAANECMRLASDPLDPDKGDMWIGVHITKVDGDVAEITCRRASLAAPDNPTLLLNLARTLIKQNNYNKASEYLRKSSDLGYRFASYLLGQIYYFGFLGIPDYEKAIYWAKLSAKRNYIQAYTAVGRAYFKYYKVNKDKKNISIGIDWYLKGAAKGDPTASYSLGVLYLEGALVKKNGKEAVHWLEKSAKEDFVFAMILLARMYDEERGVKKDLKKSFMWWLEAAKKDYGLAQLTVGERYRDGVGTKKNKEKSLYWMNKARAFPKMNESAL